MIIKDFLIKIIFVQFGVDLAEVKIVNLDCLHLHNFQSHFNYLRTSTELIN